MNSDGFFLGFKLLGMYYSYLNSMIIMVLSPILEIIIRSYKDINTSGNFPFHLINCPDNKVFADHEIHVTAHTSRHMTNINA